MARLTAEEKRLAREYIRDKVRSLDPKTMNLIQLQIAIEKKHKERTLLYELEQAELNHIKQRYKRQQDILDYDLSIFEGVRMKMKGR